MLINIDTGKVITRIPHKKSFEAWRKQISNEDYQAVVDELNKRIDENPEVHTAGWIPGHDWTDFGRTFLRNYRFYSIYGPTRTMVIRSLSG